MLCVQFLSNLMVNYQLNFGQLHTQNSYSIVVCLNSWATIFLIEILYIFLHVHQWS